MRGVLGSFEGSRGAASSRGWPASGGAPQAASCRQRGGAVRHTARATGAITRAGGGVTSWATLRLAVRLQAGFLLAAVLPCIVSATHFSLIFLFVLATSGEGGAMRWRL